MTRRKSTDEAALAEAKTMLRAAFDAGYDYYAQHPDEVLTKVHRFASANFVGKEQAFEFVAGYSKARDQRDEFLRRCED